MERLPTLKEEVTRKAVEALEALVNQRSRRLITEAQYATGLSVLWETAAGLADKDFMEMISLTSVNRNDPSFARRSFFAKRDQWVLLTLTTAGEVVVRSNKADPRTIFSTDEFDMAVRKYEEVACSIELKGFAPIN